MSGGERLAEAAAEVDLEALAMVGHPWIADSKL